MYPALAAVAELKQKPDAPALMWVGSIGGMEEALVQRENLPYKAISAGGLRGKNPLTVIKNLISLARGYRHSRQLIRQFQPDVLLMTGGYVGVPVTLAAWRTGVPVVIYLPDIEPGLAIKFLARFAGRVAVTAAEAQAHFKPGQTVVTGYPLRPDLSAATEQPDRARQAARQRLGLTDDLPVLLVFGGSRGAHSINRAVTAHLVDHLRMAQLLHITGTLDEAWVQTCRRELPSKLQARYYVWPYLHEQMVDALLAADLVISRAGASVLGEFPAAGLPAILAPYPYAGAHQMVNANYLAQNGAAIIIKDAKLQTQLKETVQDLWENPHQLHAMRTASKKLAQPQAAAQLAQVVAEVGTYGS